MISSSLFLNRMLVFYNGKAIYDNEFHMGLNVIRGEHSVGKTTILELLFYCLGGEIKSDQWLYPANICDRVITELYIGKRVFTLRRKIKTDSIPEIEIYSGTYSESCQMAEGWISYGARRRAERYSFSQQIFELLGWEHHKTDDYANLTMHQILRMLYVDQETPSSKLFRAELPVADSESTKTAIAEFMLGLDDLESHRLRQDLVRYEKEWSKVKEELAAIFTAVGKDSNYSVETLMAEIAQMYDQMKQCNEDRLIVLQSHENDEDVNTKKLAEGLSREIDNLTIELNQKQEELVSRTLELSDCLEFSENIGYRKKSLLESKDSYEYLGRVEFKYCPSCNSAIEEIDDGCSLCKSVGDGYELSESYLQILNELNFQENQNNTVMERLKAVVESYKSEIQIIYNKLQNSRLNLRQMVSYNSEKEERISTLSKEYGFLEAQVEYLKEKIELVERLDALRDKKETLNDDISETKTELLKLREKNKIRRSGVIRSIAKTALEILEDDLDYEEVFEEATMYVNEVEIDFGKDRWLIDGRAKFSASSNVLKKNVFHLSCFINSLNNDAFRYPRFLIIDDIENGGMKEVRSKNFQLLIKKKLEGETSRHQIIISTSMVDDQLNNGAYGVGRFYDKHDYVLKVK